MQTEETTPLFDPTPQIAEHAVVAMGGRYGDMVPWSANTLPLEGYVHAAGRAYSWERGDGRGQLQCERRTSYLNTFLIFLEIIVSFRQREGLYGRSLAK